MLLLFVIGDLGNTASEFAGVASVAPVFAGYTGFIAAGVLKVIMVIGAAAFVFLIVTRANYKAIERISFAFCFVYLAYVVSGIIVHPDWKDVITQTFVPHFSTSKAYLLMIIAVIGTTISPWMQFYIQAAVVDKGIREDDYPLSRIDVVTRALFTDFIAYFIIVASAATIYIHNLHIPAAHQITINDASDVAVALQPLAGKFASLLFALGQLNAAVFTASILPLSTAYYVCEAFGFERGVEHRFNDAKVFYSLYLALIVISAGVVIIPGAPLLSIIIYSQVVNGVLLPILLVLMLLLINNRRLMGTWTNSPLFNVIAWATAIIVAALTLISTAQTVFPSLGS